MVIPSSRNSALYANSPSDPKTVTQGLAQAIRSASISTWFSSDIASTHRETNNNEQVNNCSCNFRQNQEVHRSNLLEKLLRQTILRVSRFLEYSVTQVACPAS